MDDPHHHMGTGTPEGGHYAPPVDPPDALPVEPLDPLLLAEVLERLAARQDAVERAFDALDRRLGGHPKEGPWAWRYLSPAQARALFEQLRDWVDWLTATYELRGDTHAIPSCWYRHPAAVEELTALMVAWRAAYTLEETAPSDAPINWHDRWLWSTLHRLNTQLRVWAKCTGGTHQPGRPAPNPTDENDFAEFLHQHTGQSATTNPGPTPEAAVSLSDSQIRALLDSGHAEALLPGDPRSPVRHHGRWYAIPDTNHASTASDSWTLVDNEQGGRLNSLQARLLTAAQADYGRGGPG